jgi:hypothetical protein
VPYGEEGTGLPSGSHEQAHAENQERACDRHCHKTNNDQKEDNKHQKEEEPERWDDTEASAPAADSRTGRREAEHHPDRCQGQRYRQPGQTDT